MSYTGTGTGTEADPYVIDSSVSCEDFLWVIQQTGVYIKMTTFVDFSQDLTYRSGISTAIPVRCAKLYSDVSGADQTKYGITGLKISQSYFLQAGYTNSIFENISIVNCVYSATGNGNSVFTPYSSNRITFNDCVISMIVNGFNYSVSFGNAPYLNRCSVYFVLNIMNGDGFFNYGTVTPTEANSRFIDTCIQFTGYKLPTASSRTIRLISSATRCSIIGDWDISDLQYGGLWFGGMNNCCFAVTITVSDTQTASSAVSTGNLSGVSIFDRDIVDQKLVISQTSNLQLLTTSLMKDRAYLERIGFIY